MNVIERPIGSCVGDRTWTLMREASKRQRFPHVQDLGSIDFIL